MEPSPGKVIVRPSQEEQKFGLLYLPQSDRRQSAGEVIAVYKEFIDPDTGAEVHPFLQEGDWVIFGQHSGADVSYNRERYIILREQEILARVRGTTVDPNEVEALG